MGAPVGLYGASTSYKGRKIALLPPYDEEGYAVLPPNWDPRTSLSDPQWDTTLWDDMEILVPLWNQYADHTKFLIFKLIPSVVYAIAEKSYLEDLSPNHNFFQSEFFRGNYVDKYKGAILPPCNMMCPFTGVVATGIPQFVIHNSLIGRQRKQIDELLVAASRHDRYTIFFFIMI